MRGRGFLTYSACLIAMIAMIAVAVACGRDPELGKAMDRAEAVMNEHPDSALRILETHRPAENARKSDLARHSLLTAMARDKSLPATDTTFKYLQPAIDYYAEGGHGTPDDRLRTFFYQGIIYRYRAEYEKSMRAFQRGHALKNEATDSLTYANLAYEQGKLYYSAHRIIEYCNNNKEASRIYEKLGNAEYEADCLNEIGRAAIMMDDKKLADSVANVMSERIRKHPELKRRLLSNLIACRFTAASKEDAPRILAKYEAMTDYDDAERIELAYGYYMIGQLRKAAEIIECVTDTNFTQSPKYRSIKGESYRAIGRYEESAAELSKCVKSLQDWLTMLVSNDLSFADAHYNLEVENVRNEEEHRRTLIIGCSIFLMLALALVLLFMKLRNSKLRARSLELAVENISLQSEQLREERDNLISIQQEEKEHDAVVRKTLDSRIEAINRSMAFRLTDEKGYEKEYEKWKKRTLSDRKKFLKENRLAITSAHPGFIRRLEEAGLDEDEIEYMCLYALGLNGKKIGEFLEKPRFYHVVVEIRKKLNLTDSRVSLTTYIRSIFD